MKIYINFFSFELINFFKILINIFINILTLQKK